MSNKVFFGLVRKKNTNPYGSMYSFGSEPEYELYLINDSDHPVTVKRKLYGGFKTTEDIVATTTPHDRAVNITIEPHSYIVYTELYEDTFNGDAGVTQIQAVIDIEDCTKVLEIMFARGAGMLNTLLPCVNLYGRIVKPHIRDLAGNQ